MNEVETAARLRGSFVESVLLQMNERGGSMGREALDAFTEDPRGSVEALSSLHEQGLVEQPDSEGGRLTPFGVRVAKLVKQSLLAGSRRADAVQRGVLKWLDGLEHEPASLADYMSTDNQATAFGVSFTNQEVLNAAELLEHRGFIKVLHTMGAAFLRPRITADGRAALMSEVLITEYGRSNPTMITNDYSNKVSFGDNATAAGVIAGGRGHSQEVSQTFGASQATALRSLISEVAGIIEELPNTAVRHDLQEIVKQLADEAEMTQPRQSVIRDLMLKATGTAAGVVGTEMGAKVLEGFAQMAQLLQ